MDLISMTTFNYTIPETTPNGGSRPDQFDHPGISLSLESVPSQFLVC